MIKPVADGAGSDPRGTGQGGELETRTLRGIGETHVKSYLHMKKLRSASAFSRQLSRMSSAGI